MATWHSRTRVQALTFVLTWFFVQVACAQVILDKLTDCEGLAATHGALQRYIDRAPKGCRSPPDVIGRAILARSRVVPSASCFLRDPPAHFLSTFTCLSIRSGTYAELNCYRPTRLSDVRSFKSEFASRFDRASVEYLRKAAGCAISGGDTGALSLEIYPRQLMFVSRSEFGFIGDLKEESRSGNIVHAFARVDPSLRAAPDAIEAFSMSVGGTIRKQDPNKFHRANGWRAYIEDDDEYVKGFERQYKDSGIAMRVKSLEIQLSRPIDFSGRYKQRIDEIHGDLVRQLEAEGFEEQDLSDVKLSDGRAFAEALEELKASTTPFGMRRVYSLSERHGDIAIMINRKRPSCAQGDNGVFMAFVGTEKPDPNEKSDYGSTSLMIAGLGACGRFSGSIGRYADGLLSDAKNRFLRSL